MGQVLLAIIGLFLVWDAVWWFLGVKPRFPWQLKARLGDGASDLSIPGDRGYLHDRPPLALGSLRPEKKGYARVYNLTWGMVGWKMYEWVSRLRENYEPPTT